VYGGNIREKVRILAFSDANMNNQDHNKKITVLPKYSEPTKPLGFDYPGKV
jgi:hypothetical protein